jgi:hypothetical protein
MPTSYNKIYTDEIVNVFTNNLRDEFAGSANIYVSEDFKRKGNQSIRVHLVRQSFSEINDDRFLNIYSLEIKLYAILIAKNDLSYKDFFNSLHRIEQFILAYQETFEDGQELLNFKINTIQLNDLDGIEDSIRGLQTATFNISFSMLKG